MKGRTAQGCIVCSASPIQDGDDPRVIGLNDKTIEEVFTKGDGYLFDVTGGKARPWPMLLSDYGHSVYAQSKGQAECKILRRIS